MLSTDLIVLHLLCLNVERSFVDSKNSTSTVCSTQRYYVHKTCFPENCKDTKVVCRNQHLVWILLTKSKSQFRQKVDISVRTLSTVLV